MEPYVNIGNNALNSLSAFMGYDVGRLPAAPTPKPTTDAAAPTAPAA